MSPYHHHLSSSPRPRSRRKFPWGLPPYNIKHCGQKSVLSMNGLVLEGVTVIARSGPGTPCSLSCPGPFLEAGRGLCRSTYHVCCSLGTAPAPQHCVPAGPRVPSCFAAGDSQIWSGLHVTPVLASLLRYQMGEFAFFVSEVSSWLSWFAGTALYVGTSLSGEWASQSSWVAMSQDFI